jgi:hypothetical protein
VVVFIGQFTRRAIRRWRAWRRHLTAAGGGDESRGGLLSIVVNVAMILVARPADGRIGAVPQNENAI